MDILTIPVVAVAQGPVSVVLVVVVTDENTVLVPELMVEVVVDCFTDRQEQPLLMREGVGYALM